MWYWPTGCEQLVMHSSHQPFKIIEVTNLLFKIQIMFIGKKLLFVEGSNLVLICLNPVKQNGLLNIPFSNFCDFALTKICFIRKQDHLLRVKTTLFALGCKQSLHSRNLNNTNKIQINKIIYSQHTYIFSSSCAFFGVRSVCVLLLSLLYMGTKYILKCWVKKT